MRRSEALKNTTLEVEVLGFPVRVLGLEAVYQQVLSGLGLALKGGDTSLKMETPEGVTLKAIKQGNREW